MIKLLNALSDSKVLVTGGAKRIGKAIVEAFADAGAEIRIHCNNSKKEAESLLTEIPTKGDVFQADLSDIDKNTIKRMLEGVDILVNNASVYFSEENVQVQNRDNIDQKNFQINYEAPAELMDFMAAKNRKGCIINLLDAEALKASNASDSYKQSKFLLYIATRAKAISFAPLIRVNGVAPGAVFPPDWLSGSLMEKSISEMPLKRAPSVQDVASACVFLASNNGITGEVIRIDSGRHLLP